MSFRGEFGTHWEQEARSRETSEPLWFAICQIADDADDADELWSEGGRDEEILAALPVWSDIEVGESVSWGGSTFATFDGTAWVLA